MSEQLKESMSAVMDGEADAFELRRVLDEATGNEDLREQWHRMHLMRDVLRGELASTDDARTLRERVQIELAAPFDDAVQAEPLHEVAGGGGASSRPNWLGRMTGTAVAAGVAMLIVFSADFGGAPDAPELAEADPFMNTEITEVDVTRQDALRMLHHQSNGLNASGAVPFIRMATYGRSQADRWAVEPEAPPAVNPPAER